MEIMKDAYPSEAKRDPRSQQLIKRLHAIREMAEGVRQTAGVTADKIVGVEPIAVTSSGNMVSTSNSGMTSPVPCGFFTEVNDIISSIERTVALAGDNLRRFEREF